MFRLQGLGLASISFNQPSGVDEQGNAIGAPRIFTYQSNVDNLATISADDYFLNMSDMVTEGDVIYIQASDTTTFLTFTLVDGSNVDTTPSVQITSGDIADGSVTLVKLAPDVLANFLQVNNNLNDLGNVSTARNNLGLGSAALLDVTDFLRPSQNLNDVSNKTTSFNTISPVTSKGDLIVGNGVNSNTKLTVGADTLFLQADSSTATGLKWTAIAGADATKITKDVNQVAHGFAVEDVLTFAGGVYTKAQADTLANSQVVGMVNAVTDVDNFTLIMDGYTTTLSGKTANATYYLSAVTAGLLTATEPTTGALITRPLLRTDSTTSGYFFLGKSTFTTATFLQSANNLSDITSQPTARTNLGLGTASTFNSGDFLQSANNLSDLASAATARTNLGLGTMAVINSPVPVLNGGTGATSAGAIAANNIGALAIASNLSDVNNAATARSNLGAAASATTITIAGTANEIASSIGAQDLSANRTWTLSLPSALTFTGKTITGGAHASASATLFTFTTGSIGTAVTAVTQLANNNSTLVSTTAYADAAAAAAVASVAPIGATYITQTPNATLTNEQALSVLATGIMKSTTGTGVLSIAVEGTDYYGPNGTDVIVPDGGTGVSSFTAYTPICGGTTSTGALQSVSSLGSAGDVLTSNGAGVLPTFQAAAGGGGDSVKKDINQTTHGFAVGDVIYHAGGVWAKARADVASTCDVVGVVSVVTDANNFTVVTHGYISTLSGLTADTTYFLSGATAGLLTATEPTTSGYVSKPVLQSITTTTGFVINYRGIIIGDVTVGPVMISTQTVSGVANVDFTSGLSSTYTKYKIEMTNIVPSTDNVNLLLRGSINAGSSYLSTNEYYAGMSSITSGATAANTTNNAGTAITLNGSNTLDNASGSSACEVTLTLSNLSSSAFYKHMMWQTAHSVSSTVAANTTGSGMIATTSPVDAIRILASSGNISGTFTLWGIK